MTYKKIRYKRVLVNTRRVASVFDVNHSVDVAPDDPGFGVPPPAANDSNNSHGSVGYSNISQSCHDMLEK